MQAAPEQKGNDMKHKSVTILGRKWRDKVNGNTYHSARVFVDGVLVATAPFQYGYGEQFVWSAAEALERAGVFKGKDQRQGSPQQEAPWRWLKGRLGLGYLVDCADVTKRECVAWGKADK